MEKVKLKELVKQVRGVSYKPGDLHEELNENAVILLRANNIDDGQINFDNVVYVDKSKVSAEQYLKAGDVLICASSGSSNLVGKAASVQFDIECTFGAFCKVVRPKKGFEEYLDVYFQSPIYRRKISNLALGANINNIRNEHIDSLDIPVYSKRDREEFVKKIYLLQKINANRKEELIKLDELIKSRFVEMFGDMYLNSRAWTEVPLESISEIVSGITKGRKIKTEELIEVPYMAVSNVKNGYIDWTTVKTIGVTEQELNQYRLLPDDVLMTEGGDPDKLGRGAIIRKPLDNCIHQNHIFRVRLNENCILPIFFAEYLQHQKAKRYFLACAKQTTGIASINMKQLRNLPVLVPPLALQQQFANFVAQLDKSKSAIQAALDKTQLLFDSLMQEYFG